MLYYDFDWDLSHDGIILDKEINAKKLGWKNGDYFKLVESEEGRLRLQKLDILEEFIVKGIDNESS